MSRSVQTMTFMPLASVMELTCSAPGTRVGGAGLGGLAAAVAPQSRPDSRQEPSARPSEDMRMRHLWGEVRHFTSQRKAPRRGKSSRRQGANTGEELFAVPVEGLPRNPEGADRRELCSRESRVD